MSSSKSHPYLVSLFLLLICFVALGLAYFLPKLSSPSPAIPELNLPVYPTGASTPAQPVDLSYPPPDSWTTVKLTSLGISVCLPPDWVYLKPNHIAAKSRTSFPLITINAFPGTGSGRLQDLYVHQKLASATASAYLPPLPAVDEFTLNHLPAMFVILPGYPDALVISVGAKLYEFTADSQTSQTNFYTLAGCLKPL